MRVFFLSAKEWVRVALLLVITLLVFFYFVPFLVVKEDVCVIYRDYARSNFPMRGYDNETLVKCPLLPREYIPWDRKATQMSSSRLDFLFASAPREWTLWTLTHNTATAAGGMCGDAHWHVAGYVDSEEHAKEWASQSYSDDCGTFVAHTMSIFRYAYEKMTHRERGPIVATILDVLLKI